MILHQTWGCYLLHMWTTNKDHMMHGSRKDTMDRFFCHFGPVFAFYPTDNLKSESFLKMEKTRGDIIISKKCTSHDHMLSCSWDMALDKCNCYFFILGYFLLLYSPNSPKNQNFNKLQKLPGDIIISHIFIKNYNKMM